MSYFKEVSLKKRGREPFLFPILDFGLDLYISKRQDVLIREILSLFPRRSSKYTDLDFKKESILKYYLASISFMLMQDDSLRLNYLSNPITPMVFLLSVCPFSFLYTLLNRNKNNPCTSTILS